MRHSYQLKAIELNKQMMTMKVPSLLCEKKQTYER